MNRFTLSLDSETRRRSPEVSSTAFSAQPPDLPPAAWMDMGFAAFRPLARCRRPLHPVFVHRLAPLLHAALRPRLATTPLRFTIPSPPSGWEEDSHLQAVEHARHTKWAAPQEPPSSEIQEALANHFFKVRMYFTKSLICASVSLPL